MAKASSNYVINFKINKLTLLGDGLLSDTVLRRFLPN